ncbi:hypothetical protein D7Z54_30325 [Salibacterium salarium]|uniref:Uncharacterized protein n=1 Tax=Salibacterium salarium TaxID=284579 RepID=A0A3R9PFJ2_9BACI|nr:hypothetical protein [Salibacterium salarium]RSL29592.1 hypothetical protein D7Z54_30325 [Salibacterium salarium]
MKRFGMFLFSVMFLVLAVFSMEKESIAADNAEKIEVRTIPVADVQESENKDWTLQYKIKKGDLYVECIVPDFSLSKDEKSGHGFLLVKMNGQKAAEMGQAAFMMKNLPSGTHVMEITPTLYDGKAEKESITFEVEIS